MGDGDGERGRPGRTTAGMSESRSEWETCAGSEDEGRRMKRREKNRVAAQKSRKRQTQRADLLHKACELLEQRNQKLRTEVDSLSEERRLLTQALSAHESQCPIMHCNTSPPGPPPDNMASCSVWGQGSRL